MTIDTAPLTIEDGLFELPARGPQAEPTWIWVRTCPARECTCRIALVLASTHGRDALVEPATRMYAARDAGTRAADLAPELPDVDVFEIDLDTVEAIAPSSSDLDADERLDLAAHPRVRELVARLDGETLEAIAGLWYRGKGLPDPRRQAHEAQQVVLRGWRPGDLLAYDEVLGRRSDLYELDGRLYKALELYCPVADCDCGEVVVDFATVAPRGSPHPGRVTVGARGDERGADSMIEPRRERDRDRLERLWAA